MHDTEYTDYWRECLTVVAARYNLNTLAMEAV